VRESKSVSEYLVITKYFDVSDLEDDRGKEEGRKEGRKGGREEGRKGGRERESGLFKNMIIVSVIEGVIGSEVRDGRESRGGELLSRWNQREGGSEREGEGR
jgi:hypothetical protein